MAARQINRRKRLVYRDQGGASQEAHQEHWRGFSFNAGSTVVAYAGSWGEVQVWASDESEGRRVIEHACSIAGIPTTGAGMGEWIVTTAKAGRNGKAGTFVVPTAYGFPMVIKRPGPSGQPILGEL
jgi:hypothetical protein